MLTRILAVATPIFVYATLVVLAQGLWRERKKLEWIALAPALAGLIASFIFLAPNHRLFFDEDIYINIASNLTLAPVSQITLVGDSDHIEASSYYKEPPGWPLLLSLVFFLTGRSETVAFIAARVLFAIAIGAVYQLAREALQTKQQALVAAVLFGAAPVCFWFSVSAGTDIPAALFAALGMWGCIAGNGALAAAGLGLAAQTRLELIALAPLIWLAGRIELKWKVLAAGLLTAEIAHIGWVLSLAPEFEKAEKVSAGFSLTYVAKNLAESLRYALNPMIFPAAIVVVAAVAAFLARPAPRGRTLFALQILGLSVVYLLFYAGSFEMNPRYIIQILAPLAVMAAALFKRPVLIAALVLSVALSHIRREVVPDYVEALAADHRIAVQFASQLGPDDFVLSVEPEMFFNQGRRAINAVFASEHREKLDEELRRQGKAIYHSGVRTTIVDSEEWRVDQWVKSTFELHLIDSQEVSGRTVAFYEISY